jgi:hypothetical protein
MNQVENWIKHKKDTEFYSFQLAARQNCDIGV